MTKLVICCGLELKDTPQNRSRHRNRMVKRGVDCPMKKQSTGPKPKPAKRAQEEEEEPATVQGQAQGRKVEVSG